MIHQTEFATSQINNLDRRYFQWKFDNNGLTVFTKKGFLYFSTYAFTP